jgi:hypothetical protein
MSTSELTPSHLRSKLAAVERHHPGSDTTALRAELKTAKAAKYIQTLVAEAPMLTAEQRSRLAALLTPPADGAVA